MPTLNLAVMRIGSVFGRAGTDVFYVLRSDVLDVLSFDFFNMLRSDVLDVFS